MMKKVIVRIATSEDAPSLLAVYEPYIRETAITFEYEVPSAAEFAQRIRSVSPGFPWIVCEIDGQTAGYAYASRFRPRAAFQWDAEVSIYLCESCHRLGIASALYACMEEFLTQQGYFNLYALITHPHPASEGFHAHRGFRPLGIYKATGYKFGNGTI